MTAFGARDGPLRVDACLSHESPYLRRSSAVGMGLCSANLGRSTSLSKLLRDLHALLIAHSTFGD